MISSRFLACIHTYTYVVEKIKSKRCCSKFRLNLGFPSLFYNRHDQFHDSDENSERQRSTCCLTVTEAPKRSVHGYWAEFISFVCIFKR